jgi:hypothetical protein
MADENESYIGGKTYGLVAEKAKRIVPADQTPNAHRRERDYCCHGHSYSR